MHPFEGPRLKVERAREHLESLNNLLHTFYDTHPARLSKKFDSEAGGYFFRANVHEEPPLALSIILGDVVHNLRSALDQLFWQLALKVNANPPLLNFPIFKSDSESVLKQLVKTLAHVPEGARPAIYELQPYNRGDGAELHPLWWLRCISNTDKHRLITALGIGATRPNPAIPGSVLRYLDDYMIEIFVPAPNKDFKPMIPVMVTFQADDMTFPIDPPRLRLMYEFIRDDVLPRFAGFFT